MVEKHRGLEGAEHSNNRKDDKKCFQFYVRGEDARELKGWHQG